MHALVHQARAYATAVALVVIAAACTVGEPTTTGAAPSISAAPLPTASATRAPATPSPATTPATLSPSTTCPPVGEPDGEAELEPCTYLVEAYGIPVTVEFTIPAGSSGWLPWIGSLKRQGDRPYQWVGFSIINVTNLVKHACTDHTPASPVVGPTVDDLATALAELKPFEVKTPPADVTIYGYSGKHLALVIPDMATVPGQEQVWFTDCLGQQLKSWIGEPLSFAFWGYTGSGMTEELWVLDVDGGRLVISAIYLPDSPAEDVAELRSILDSIEIVPIPA